MAQASPQLELGLRPAPRGQDYNPTPEGPRNGLLMTRIRATAPQHLRAAILSLALGLFALSQAGNTHAQSGLPNPEVVITTNYGTITLRLYRDKAPVTVENFLTYAAEGHYDGTIFHRVIPNFMIQGGGFDTDMNQKRTRDPIKNEADNGLSNKRGTLAMARTSVVDSATAQFFINLRDNSFLDHGTRDFGYAVFGEVTDGMDVVDTIAGVQTGNHQGHQDVPVEAVVITGVTID